MQPGEPGALYRHTRVGPSVAPRPSRRTAIMVMFKRSQIYIGLGLAAVVELVIRVVVH
jgi:hypothetical protein